MQHRLTTSRDSALATAAETVEAMGAGLGRVLRESRLDVFDVPDERHIRLLETIMDEDEAEQNARHITVARLTIPAEPGAWETASESCDEVLYALRRAIPELDSFNLVEADASELPAADPDGAVEPCMLDGLWYRSQAADRCGARSRERHVPSERERAPRRYPLPPRHGGA